MSRSAIAQSDLIDEALKSGSRDFYAVASLYPEYCHIIVKADSGIAGVADLLGKTVSVGDEESGTEKNAGQILKAYGISETLIKTVNMSYTEAAEALKSGEIDAMFAAMGTHTSVVEGLAEDAEIRFLPIEGDALSILLNSYDFYEEGTIPAGTYTGQAEDVATIGVNSILLMNSLVPEDTAYSITKSLFEHISDIQNEMPLTLELDLSGITIPFHPGAEKYFTEAGIDMPAADGR